MKMYLLIGIVVKALKKLIPKIRSIIISIQLNSGEFLEGSLNTGDLGKKFENDVSNDDEKIDVKSLKHFKFDVENKKPDGEWINLQKSTFTDKFVDKDEFNARSVKFPVQKVVPDGDSSRTVKHSMEEADHNVFFDVDVADQIRKKMFDVLLWSSPLIT